MICLCHHYVKFFTRVLNLPLSRWADLCCRSKMRFGAATSERRGRNMERRFRKCDRSRLSPVISGCREAENMSLPSFRKFCDYCMEPVKPGRRKMYGRVVTHLNADKLVNLRHLAELALKFFNDDKSTSFKLVKVCKINRPRPARYGLTFTAQEDGVKECLVFRGVVYKIRGSMRLCFVRSRMMMVKLHFGVMTMITSVQKEHVKVKIDLFAYVKGGGSAADSGDAQ